MKRYMFLLELNYSPFVPHFVLERRGVRYNMETMKFKNKKEEEEFKDYLKEAMELLEQQNKYYFKPAHIIPILEKMTPDQIMIFEHLTGIRRQTIH